MRQALPALIFISLIGLSLAARGWGQEQAGARLAEFDPAPSGGKPHAQITSLEANGSVNLKTGEAFRSLNVTAMLHIPDTLDAVGVAHRVQVTRLTDENGGDLLADWRKSAMALFEGQRYYTPLSDFRDSNEPTSLMTVTAAVSSLPKIPTRFGVVRGTAYVLVAGKRVVRDVTPVAPGELVELTPTLAVRVTRIKHEGNKLELFLAYEAEEPSPFFNPNGKPPIVDNIVLLDDRGDAVTHGPWSPQKQDGEGPLFGGEGRMTFELGEGRKPGVLRFEVVTDVRELRVDFEAKDVKMPIAAE